MTIPKSDQKGKPRTYFRHSVMQESPEGRVVNYLLSNPLWGEAKGRTMFMEGAMLLWLPYALNDQPDAAHKAALHSIKTMKRAIAGLMAEFGITEADTALSTTASVMAAPAIATPTITEPSSTHVMTGGFDPTLYAGINLDDPAFALDLTEDDVSDGVAQPMPRPGGAE